jgi:O-antigen ligase
MIKFNFQQIKSAKIPVVVWLVIISTFIALTFSLPLLGRQLAGWAWVIPLVVSLLSILQKPRRISFPTILWLPWICIVSLWFTTSGFSYLQRTVLLLCPIIVGIAVSTYLIREFQIKMFLELIRLFLFLFFVTVIVRTGLLFTGVLPQSTGLAAQSMTAALLCTIFGVEYSINRKRSLLHWIVGAAIPFIALTRMAITAAGITIPLTFASLKMKKRLIFLAIIAALAVTFFYTERVQRKMFYSGAGTLQDVRLSNPDFFTTGRSHLWDLMVEEIKEKPLWGHGANASEEFVLSATWGTLTHPHNDWLRLLYDYGLFGTSVFAFCLVAQVIHLLKRAKNTFGEARILLYAGASSFLPFVLLMFTDNIILYAAFFGNLQFTIIGLVYAAQKTQEIDAWHYFNASTPTGRPNFSHLQTESRASPLTPSLSPAGRGEGEGGFMSKK